MKVTAPSRETRPAIVAFCVALSAAALVPAQEVHAPPAAWGARTRGHAGIKDRKVGNAIDKGLRWLIAHQDDDGRWDADAFMKHDTVGAPCDGSGDPVHDVGVTALATLALLGDGAARREGEPREAVLRALQWLRGEQVAPDAPKDAGLVGVDASHDYIYAHLIATLALCEAHGEFGGDTWRTAAQAALDHARRHRSPEGLWRYEPMAVIPDTSVVAWGLIANAAGREVGLIADEHAAMLAESWLDEITTPTTGTAGYTERGQVSARLPGDHRERFPANTLTMTAVALHGRHAIGQRAALRPVMSMAVQQITASAPEWAGGTTDLYFWFHASQALQGMGVGAKWLDQLSATLVKAQREHGNEAGSWDPVSVWSEVGGRVYSTAMAVLVLEAPIRQPTRDPLAFVPEDRKFAQLRRRLSDADYGRAQRELDRLRGQATDDASKRVIGEAEAWIAKAEAAAKDIIALWAAPDALQSSSQYVVVHEQLEQILRQFDGMSPQASAKALIADQAFVREMRAAKALASVMQRHGTWQKVPDGKRQRVVESLRALADEFPDTRAAAEANRLVRRLGGDD